MLIKRHVIFLFVEYISIILATKIAELLNESGADEAEKYDSLAIAGMLVRRSPGSVWAKTVEREEAEKTQSS